ncbi:rCG26260, partial [Rattus norvegicus]
MSVRSAHRDQKRTLGVKGVKDSVTHLVLLDKPRTSGRASSECPKILNHLPSNQTGEMMALCQVGIELNKNHN